MPKEALKMVFGVRSIRVFSQFSLDPYYEPLPWFMIAILFMVCMISSMYGSNLVISGDYQIG